MWIQSTDGELYNASHIVAIAQDGDDAPPGCTRIVAELADRLVVLGSYRQAVADEEMKALFRDIKDNKCYYSMRTPKQR